MRRSTSTSFNPRNPVSAQPGTVQSMQTSALRATVARIDSRPAVPHREPLAGRASHEGTVDAREGLGHARGRCSPPGGASAWTPSAETLEARPARERSTSARMRLVLTQCGTLGRRDGAVPSHGGEVLRQRFWVMGGDARPAAAGRVRALVGPAHREPQGRSISRNELGQRCASTMAGASGCLLS